MYTFDYLNYVAISICFYTACFDAVKEAASNIITANNNFKVAYCLVISVKFALNDLIGVQSIPPRSMSAASFIVLPAKSVWAMPSAVPFAMFAKPTRSAAQESV